MPRPSSAREKTEKKKSMLDRYRRGTAGLLVVAGGAAIFLLTRHDTSGGKLASREEEAEIENFLKGVKIGGRRPRCTAQRRRSPRRAAT